MIYSVCLQDVSIANNRHSKSAPNRISRKSPPLFIKLDADDCFCILVFPFEIVIHLMKDIRHQDRWPKDSIPYFLENSLTDPLAENEDVGKDSNHYIHC